jgi:preprotein translocase subunit SecF
MTKMMTKLLTKTTKKLTLLCLVMTLLVALSVVFTAIFGINTAARISDQTTVNVKMSAVYYRDDTKREAVEKVCEDVFKAQKLNVWYVYNSQMSGDECELMYVFSEKANVAEAKVALEQAFAADAYDGAFISVETGKEVVKTVIAPVTLIRAAIAVVVFAIFAFIYTWITYGWSNAIVTVSSIVLSCLLTAALILLVRIPVTVSAVYVCVIAAMLAGVLVSFNINKIRADETDSSIEEKVIKAVAVKEIFATAILLGGALVLVGAIATWAVRRFALCALIGVLVSAAVALFVAPALQLPLLEKQAKADAERTKYGYVGAKKAEKAEEAEE